MDPVKRLSAAEAMEDYYFKDGDKPNDEYIFINNFLMVLNYIYI